MDANFKVVYLLHEFVPAISIWDWNSDFPGISNLDNINKGEDREPPLIEFWQNRFLQKLS